MLEPKLTWEHGVRQNEAAPGAPPHLQAQGWEIGNPLALGGGGGRGETRRTSDKEGEGEEGDGFAALVLEAHPSTANARCQSISMGRRMLFMRAVCKSLELYNTSKVTQQILIELP